jgi:hypothetical protein
MRTGWLLSVGVLALFGVACGEELDPASNRLRDPNAEDGAGGPVPDRFQCKGQESRVLANEHLRRLTKAEIQSSLKVAFGGALTGRPEITSALEQLPDDSPGDLAKEFQDAYSPEHANALLSLGDELAEAVMTSPADKTRIFGACAAQPDEACAKAFLSKWGASVLRRPLSEDRIARLMPAYRTASAANGPEYGLRALMMVLIQAPEFLYHFEEGRPKCGAGQSGDACPPEPSVNGRTPLDDYAIAERIAFAVTGSPPDEALLGAAERQELRAIPGVEAQVVRLLGTEAARGRWGDIVDSWLMAKSIPDPSPVMAKVADIDGTGLKVEARQELIDFVSYIVFEKNGNVDDLATQAVGFPRSERMAKIYGSSIASGKEPVALPNGHGGLLLRASTLLAGRTESSPISRGVYVRKRVLCDPLASPDFAIVAQRTEELGAMDRTKMSGRQIATTLTSPAACAACHTRINPLGFALEGFDPLGRKREKETVFSEMGVVVAEHPLDTSASGLNLEEGAPDQVKDATELSKAIAGSEKLRACLIERMYMTAHLRQTKAEDGCALGDAYRALSKGSVKDAFVKTTANEDILWRTDVGAP